MPVLAVVVAYHPNASELHSNIDSFLEDVSHVLLWQNSPVMFSHPKVELCGDGTNRGIAVALNYAWKYAKEKGYDWILIMDQDSKWVDFHAHLVQACSDGAPEGILTARMADEPAKEGFTVVNSIINSGTMVRVKTIDAIGGWNEDFKVYGVDVEFYLKALSKGYKAYQLSEGCLVHNLGYKEKHRLLGRTYTTINYSPQRLYEIYRNHWIVIRQYPEVASDIKDLFITSCYKTWFPRMLLGEKNRPAKLWAIIRGTWDGLTYKIDKRRKEESK